MNFKKMFLLLFLFGMKNSNIFSMDYNIIDPSIDENKPTSFLGILASHRRKEANKKELAQSFKKGIAQDVFVLPRSLSVSSFESLFAQQKALEIEKNQKKAKRLQWDNNYYTKKEVKSESFFLKITTSVPENHEKLISPTSITGAISPIIIKKNPLKSALKKKSAYN